MHNLSPVVFAGKAPCDVGEILKSKAQRNVLKKIHHPVKYVISLAFFITHFNKKNTGYGDF